MEKTFNGISYDLANNFFLSEDNKFDTLKRYSLMLLSVTFFKRSRTITDITESRELHQTRHITIADWKDIEMCVETEFMLYLEVKKFNRTYFEPYVKEINHFVSMQIYDFVTKGVITDIIELELFLQNLYFTNLGTINLINTVLRILKEPSSLSQTIKFNLACYYFIEECIHNLFENLNTVEEQFKELLNDSLFVQFWIHIIENFPGSSKEISSDTILSLFQTAVENNNEIAVHYLWFNFINGGSNRKMVFEKIIPIIMCPERINICMFLLFQINESEFEIYFKSSKLIIIQNIIKNIRWHSHLFRIINMVKSDIDINFLESLVIILTESYFSTYPVGINAEAIVHCYISVLEYVQDDELSEIQFLYQNLVQILLNTFIHKKKDLVKLSKFYGRIEMKKFLISEHGVIFISEAIKIENLETIEEFLFSLFPKNDVEEIQKNFFNLNASYVSLYFIAFLRFQELRLFISKWSVSEVVCQRFKRQILHMNQGFFIKRILFNMDTYSIEESFSFANEVLTWFCEDDFSILIFKRSLILDADEIDDRTKDFRVPFYNEVRDFVMQSKWELLGLLLQWKESLSKEKRDLYIRLLNDNLLIPVMPMMDERLEFLYQFIQFLKTHLLVGRSKDDDDINTFKEYVFNVNKFHKLLTKGKLNTIKNYIKWLEPSCEKLQKFKWRAELLVGNNHEIVSWLESLQNH
ncbi:UNVERIFIED_CONTAM: hypothetical protein RMT77_011329 [Armadillidium vulgare]